MFINDLRQERTLLQLTQEHHLNKLYAADNPSGILLCQKHHKGIRWQRRDLQNGQLITVNLSKKENKLAEKLAVNLYRLICIQNLQSQIAIIDNLIRNYSSGTQLKKTNAETEKEEIAQNSFLTGLPIDRLFYRVRNRPHEPADFFDVQSPYRPFIVAHLQSEYADIIEWYLGEFVQYNEHPERRQFPVKLGYNVRSKSEVMAADRLFEEGILFHYEERLLMQFGDPAWPDFLIPITLFEKYAWEHYGAMDEEKYYNRTRGKILNYLDNRCLPGINMITTYETRKNPLTEEQVDQKIRWIKYRYRLAFADLPPDESFNLYDLAAHVKQYRNGRGQV